MITVNVCHSVMSRCLKCGAVTRHIGEIIEQSGKGGYMGKDSKIEWTNHTFSPWRGCTKVSAGCDNCYAEKMSGRNPKTLGVWGKHGTRVVDAMESMQWEEESPLWNDCIDRCIEIVRETK